MVSDRVSDGIAAQMPRTSFLIDDKCNYKLKDCVIDNHGGRAFALSLCPYPGEFRQLMCPHPGEFAHFFLKIIMPRADEHCRN